MMYLGLWSHQNHSDIASKLTSTLKQYMREECSFIAKNNFTLAYGNQHPEQDMDQVWKSDSAVLIGRIFDKEAYSLVKTHEFIELAQEFKRDLTKKIWGKYICWITDGSSKLEIMVDPTGQLPCFYYTLPDGSLLFSSHIKLIERFLSARLDYDWGYLCSYLFYGNSSDIKTPFKGVKEIPPGCSLIVTSGQCKVIPFWNPFVAYASLDAPSANAVEVLQSVLKPMIEPYQNICVSLSGGLDSSSLVYCLSEIVRSNQKLIALNYFHSAVQSSNELPYARKVCEEVGIELIEVDASRTLPFDPYEGNQNLKLNKPFPGCISLATINEVPRHLPSNGSCVFLSGHGSDHIFMRPPTQDSIADYLLMQGIKGLKDKIKDITHFYRDSLTPVLLKNMKNLFDYFLNVKNKKRENDPQDKPPRWLMPKIYQYKTKEFIHPIYRDLPSRVLPGKYNQIDALYEGLASIHVNAEEQYPEHYPFFYEPVVEFALSFPTYDLFQNGYDRYPLRQAVSSHFQTDVVWRRDKGQTTGILQLGVKKNIDYVQELCLEGEFVKQGFVDRDGLYQTILMISNGDNNDLWPFTHLASVEIFLRMWQQQ